ncbi:hypothetical protein [Rathayibacter agropyri]|uniref:hypothetical protein n=1 Tax=Rathayibacter agropyri TaxID=1634927 RepID=UPI0015644BC9|nr:hypothetical protein [Rathayibacter agropyri]NRD08784.1 hypothetical protein [Rathayibacter agropyri]
MPSAHRLVVPVTAMAALLVGLALPRAAVAAPTVSMITATVEQPVSTEVPSVPGIPAEPGDGGSEPVPEVPEESSIPGVPVEPTMPEQPVPGDPALEQASQPEQPSQPQQPSQPEQPNAPQPADQAPESGQPGGSSSGGGTGGTSGNYGAGSSGGTATTDAGVTAPRVSAPGRTTLSTSAATNVQKSRTASQPASSTATASVFLSRQTDVDPGSLTVELARFYGVGVSYAGFDPDETVTATLRNPDGGRTPLALQPNAGTTGDGTASVPTAMIAKAGAYTVELPGDRGSTAKVGFRLADSSGVGLLLEPRDFDGTTTEAPRGAVWGFDAEETVAVGAFRTTGDRAELAAGDVAVQSDGIGWAELVLGHAIVAEPDAAVYCIVAFGRDSHRTAAVTVAYREGESTAPTWEAPQVCGTAISAARSEFMTAAVEAGPAGITPITALMLGGGAVVASLLACAVVLFVLRRRRENTDLFIGGPLPRQE